MDHEFWGQLLALVGGLFGGGTLVKLYSLWQKRRAGDQEYISDRYRQLVEDERLRVEQERRTVDGLRRRLAKQDDTIDDLKAELEDKKLTNLQLRAWVIEQCNKCQQEPPFP